mmetsp:Transcript_11921/g.26759  ORF Transcript_11921/g.26759 Transcript_11921/m.26759 type:complete len:111 (-) Transcript_11921:162-494(-)
MQQGRLKAELKVLLDKVQYSTFAGTFSHNQPHPGYESTSGPSDLSVVVGRWREGDYYRSREMLRADLLRMTQHARFHEQADERAAAAGLEKYVKELFDNKPAAVASVAVA